MSLTELFLEGTTVFVLRSASTELPPTDSHPHQMNSSDIKKALATASEAARAAGALMRKNLNLPKKINSQVQHDIKLDLDVRCQKLIELALLLNFPQVAVLGEEGVQGDQSADARWVVDPIDGTVNFTYGVPHACVSIALQIRRARSATPARKRGDSGVLDDDSDYETLVGVVYDPFSDELWTAIRGQPARLNGRIIRISNRNRLDESLISLGFAKSPETMAQTLPAFNQLIHRARKIRIMGAAALAMTYVASGRFDAYVEAGVRVWDIAAGGLILECAGGEFWHRQLPGEHVYAVNANNGRLRRKIEAASRPPRKLPGKQRT